MAIPTYQDPFRPVYEVYSVVAWLAAAALLAGSAWASPFPAKPFLACAAFGIVMAALRGWQCRKLWRRRRRLAGSPLTFMTFEELRRICEKRPNAIWMGRGFTWSQHEAQLMHEVTRADPERLAPRNDEIMGQRWIHGLGEADEDLWLPLEHNAGHMLLAGTTRSGKTRLLDLMISQAIIRRECVIIFDPKGDKDLRLAAKQACRALGRADAFVHFHPAFPSQSVRIDPLRNFNRSTEIATRIATLIPSETGADPFAAFGQMALNNIVQGLLLIDAKPNLIVLRRYLEGGPASLLVRACQAYFERKLANWQEQAKPYLAKVKGASDEDLAPAYIQFYRDKLQPNTSLSSSELEGLMGSFEHDRVHLGKMLTSLMPVLNMLTTGELGRLLSPDVNDVGDPRDVTDFQRIIRNTQVCYIGLDSLSDSMIGSAIGSLLLADLVAVAGARYNYGQSPTSPGGAEPKLAPVNIFIDEAAEIINDPFVQLLNKGGGALMRCICAAQTFADFAARIGSEHKARMILGNLNNLCAMRVIDGHTQKYITESFPETVLQTIERAHSNNASSEDPLRFSGGASERLAEKEAPLVPPALLGCLPNLENFMRISAGRILKGRVPILVKGTA